MIATDNHQENRSPSGNDHWTISPKGRFGEQDESFR